MPVVFMADDAYGDWAGRFLRSLREQAPDATVLCIPYSDATTRIQALLREHRATMIAADFTAIDAFAAEFFPAKPLRRRNLRKLVALDLPGPPYLYMDCDQLVTGPLPRVLAELPAADADLVYFATSLDFVFAAGAVAPLAGRFPGQPLVSMGNIAVLRPFCSVAEAMATIRANAALFRWARHLDVVDQPLFNLLFRLRGARALALDAAVTGVTGEGFFRDPRLRTDAEGLLWRGEDRVVAVHFAGADKTGAAPALLPLMQRHGLAGAAAPTVEG